MLASLLLGYWTPTDIGEVGRPTNQHQQTPNLQRIEIIPTASFG